MSRQSHAEAMTGVSDSVRRDVRGDLAAMRKGPLTAERRLCDIDAETIRIRYSALLALNTYPDLRPSQAERFDRAEAVDEVTQIRRGGNR